MPNRPFDPSFDSSVAPSSAPSSDILEALFRAVEQSSDGVGLFRADDEPRLVFANSAFSTLLGCTPSALGERSLTTLFDDAQVSRTLREAIQASAGCRAHALLHDDAQQARALAISISPVSDGDATRPTHWLCSLRELSEERDGERERSERERLAAVALLAAGLAHEINNPLASVTTNLEWLAATLPSMRPSQSTPRPQELPALSAALVDALAGAERIEATVRQLNALTGIHNDAHELLDVRVLLDAAIREVEPLVAGGIQVRRDYADVPPMVLGAEGRLKQAFVQLLANAAQAIPPDASKRRIDVRVRSSDPVRIEIKDTGSGVAPHLQSELFRPFVTTKPLGLGKGLGLYLARASIEACGGRVGFSPRSSGGTTFWVELPANKTSMRGPLESSADSELPPSAGRP